MFGEAAQRSYSPSVVRPFITSSTRTLNNVTIPDLSSVRSEACRASIEPLTISSLLFERSRRS